MFFEGGFGVDFFFDIDILEEGLVIVVKGLLQYGVIVFCLIIVILLQESYNKVINEIDLRVKIVYIILLINEMIV